jgi:hypothetical protein
MKNWYILEFLNNAIVKTKTIITLIGALNVLQGIGFILGGETLTKQSFPEDMLTGGAVEVLIAFLAALAFYSSQSAKS